MKEISLPLIGMFLWASVFILVLTGYTPNKFSSIIAYGCLVLYSLIIHNQDKTIGGLRNGKK